MSDPWGDRRCETCGLRLVGQGRQEEITRSSRDWGTWGRVEGMKRWRIGAQLFGLLKFILMLLEYS